MTGQFESVDAYLAAQAGPGRDYAERLRAIVRAAAPGLKEAIKYDMPAFQLGGRSFLYCAVWQKHLGVYPVYRGDTDFEARLGRYRAKKDTVQFLYAEPLPEDLVMEIAQAQARSITPGPG
ncbi:iron chaperone [Sphingomonas psychrotolerans]|uniref:YdhG-like domain-containing protein n=1 Tax=Sphingomonas psychrotolerans TaxID=1327635 RepID=A0A2K8MCM0_9SPHN|nr:DUF1801 domain-containing protein [Sphingomonas psychrotolerans]ATY31642.1 hypothetical protein CVN68_06385 [Sphingomonas psychrotolerans]